MGGLRPGVPASSRTRVFKQQIPKARASAEPTGGGESIIERPPPGAICSNRLTQESLIPHKTPALFIVIENRLAHAANETDFVFQQTAFFFSRVSRSEVCGCFWRQSRG